MERTAIGYWTQAPGQKGFDVHVVTDLTREEFDRYYEATTTYRAVTERGAYQLLLRQWDRLRSMRAMYTNLERVGGSFRAVDTRSLSVLFMGEVTSWLAATRLYLESERDSIARRFGEESEQAARVTAATNRVFDANPAYRFLYNLRDYSQHCGAPLGGLTVASQPDGSRSVDLYLSRSELLLAHFDWSRHAKTLLEEWDEQILLMPLIDEAMRGFREIEDEALAILIERCGDALATLRQGILRAAVATNDGHAAIFQLPNRNGDGEMAWQSFPTGTALDRLQHAIEANTPVSALRQPMVNPLSERPPEARHAEAQAAAVIGAWLEFGPGSDVDETINNVLSEDGDVSPLVAGLVNLSAYLLSMLSISLGTTPQAMLGGFVAEDRFSVVEASRSDSAE